MEKKNNQKLGVETSLLGFGAMRLATQKDGSIDYKASEAMIDKAVAGGVNYFDTAYVYHGQKSEGFLGDALVSRYPRDSFYLATKLPTFNVTKAAELDAMLDESLRRLKTDHIDFYLLHAIDLDRWEKMKKFGVVEFIDRAKKSGKIRRIGFSSHANAAEYQKIVDDYPGFEFTQLQINYADWATNPDTKAMYEIAEKAGIPLVVMEPVRGGGLSNPDSPAVKKIQEKLSGSGVTPAALAFRWAAELKNAFVILSGMSTLQQVEENVATFSPVKPLSSAELAAINETVGVLKSLPTVPCTGCEYCVDGCPKQINIPELFDRYNAHLFFKNTRNFVQFYPPEGKRASDCVECGACSAVCPQHIDIPAQLKVVDALYQQVSAE
ncbi:MAG: aldo/keto reductase [Clostridiales bacterium]|jgi:predicted aldo/keto reductase-like oxidoreductase|nr:aldo/keto reductase [Clostridiales bacterium]